MLLGEGLFLVMCGLIKKVVISDYISVNFVDRIFDNPMLYTGFENLMGVYGYTLQIYCDFSGYSDMAIGIALLMGYRFKSISILPISRVLLPSSGVAGISLCRVGCETISIYLWAGIVEAKSVPISICS